MTKLQTSIRDLLQTLAHYRIWVFLGKMDVAQRYRRSLLGPWWISLSMLIFVFSMSAVFSRIFKQDLKDYVPFFTAGFLTWQLISSCVTEATDLFRSNSSYIKQINMPYNIYVFKHVARQLLVFFHNFVVYLLVAIIFRVEFGWNSFLIFPAFFLLVVTLYWVSLLIGLIGARFRDMTPIIANCIQVAFFITPVSWMPKLLSAHSLILLLNPLVYYIDIMRGPLLNIAPSATSWMVTGSITLTGWMISLLTFSHFRHRIPYWVE